MVARRHLPTAALLAGALVAASACGSSSPDSVTLPGLDGDDDLTVPTPPPLPTTEPVATVDSEVESGDVEPADAELDAELNDGRPDDEPVEPTEPPADEASGAEPTTTAVATTDAPPAPTTTEAEIRFLRIGDEGPEVASVQRRLIALEYLGAGGETGVFDRATADALVDFQAQYGLVVDGIFGPETDRALNAAAASVD